MLEEEELSEEARRYLTIIKDRTGLLEKLTKELFIALFKRLEKMRESAERSRKRITLHSGIEILGVMPRSDKTA